MSSSSPARRRLLRDLKRLHEAEPPGIVAAPVEGNLLRWNAAIFGAVDTPFEHGTFTLSLEFKEDYPHVAPDVRFVTKMFHPNVYQNGQICLDILKQRWAPTYDVCSILLSIQALLNDPNPESPANNEAANLFKESPREYIKRVRFLVDVNNNNNNDENKSELKKCNNSDEDDDDIARTAS